ncbi:MAG TPA: phosphoribosylanthranilate isomerase [Vicinamibacterales bacterium]|nr:phosphoribosylanthranilate isomerase [Vicinamibacterales bacterium]
MRTRVKICGITRERDAQAAAAAGADAIGFVLWQGSPRQVTPPEAARLGRSLPAFVTRVGVFVNASPATVTRAVREAALDAVQLHGDEDPTMYRRCGAAVIKSVSLAKAADVRRALRSPAEVTLLVDVRDLVRRGGTGRLANWALARQLARRRPILLAGGIGPSNVRRAIRDVAPWGVDVSSGVEVAPGRKSAARIAAFMANVKAADREVL